MTLKYIRQLSRYAFDSFQLEVYKITSCDEITSFYISV